MLNKVIDKYENFCAKHSRELLYTCAFIAGWWIGEERVNSKRRTIAQEQIAKELSKFTTNGFTVKEI